MEEKKSDIVILTPVLTRDNIILSFKANVSPCFILILFLSKHFIAYLKKKQQKHSEKAPKISFIRTIHWQSGHVHLQDPVSKLLKDLNPGLKTSFQAKQKTSKIAQN